MLPKKPSRPDSAPPDPLSIELIEASVDDVVEEDSRSARFEADMAEQNARFLREENENLRSTRELRETAARRAFLYLCVMSTAVFGIIMLAGFGVLGFNLDRMVLTTLAGGTFVSAIGLFGIVVKGLFPMAGKADAQREGKRGGASNQ